MSPDDGGPAPDRVEPDANVGARTGGDAGTGQPTDAGEAGPTLITVAGSVTDDLDNIVADCAINVIDAAGVSHVGLTDVAGSFTIDGVAVPYSLSVAAPPGGVPIVYVGLRTTKPLLWADSSATAPGWNTANITLDVTLPACGSECSLFLSGFANGKASYGYDVMSYTPLTVAPVNVEVGWSGSSTASAGVDVLIANASLTTFWYTQVPATVSNGVSVNAGGVIPASVPTATTLSLTSVEEGVPSGWSSPSMSIQLSYPGGGTGLLATLTSSVLSAGIPICRARRCRYRHRHLLPRTGVSSLGRLRLADSRACLSRRPR